MLITNCLLLMPVIVLSYVILQYDINIPIRDYLYATLNYHWTLKDFKGIPQHANSIRLCRVIKRVAHINNN